MIVTYEHSDEITKNIVTFWFKPERPVEYIAGQFTQIHLPHDNVDNRGDKRWFTLSSSPTDNLVSITTKFSVNNSSSFKKTLRRLKSGSILTLADPMGDFVLPKDPSIPLLFVAGGMGITPMRSMVRFLESTHEQRDIHLIYSVHSFEDFAWRESFESSHVSFTPVVTTASTTWKGETGALSAKRIAAWASRDPRQIVYLSGPETMIEQFVDELPALGIGKDRMVTDYFPGYEAV